MYHLKKYAILLIISAFDLNELTLLNLTDMRSHEYFAPHVVFHNRDCDLEKKIWVNVQTPIITIVTIFSLSNAWSLFLMWRQYNVKSIKEF